MKRAFEPRDWFETDRAFRRNLDCANIVWNSSSPKGNAIVKLEKYRVIYEETIYDEIVPPDDQRLSPSPCTPSMSDILQSFFPVFVFFHPVYQNFQIAFILFVYCFCPFTAFFQFIFVTYQQVDHFRTFFVSVVLPFFYCSGTRNDVLRVGNDWFIFVKEKASLGGI